MVIALLRSRLRLFGTVLSLACAGPAIAQPVDNACHLLWPLAELAPHLDQLRESGGSAHQGEALLVFDRALRRIPATFATDIALSGGSLAVRAPQLMAHVEALQVLRREVVQGTPATVRAAATAPELHAGAALVQQLLDAQGCRPSGWFLAGAGATSAQVPGMVIMERSPDAVDQVGMRVPGLAAAPTFMVTALLASALVALFWVCAALRKRRQLNRRHPRFGCGCWTMVEHGGKPHKSLIIDASRRGCRITKPPKVRRGNCVTIEVGGEPVSAKVMWRREYFAGFRFASALDEAQLAAFHQAGQDLFDPPAGAGDDGWNNVPGEAAPG